MLDYSFKYIPYSDVVNQLKTELLSVRKIIFFELIGLCISDGVFCEKEKELLLIISGEFKLDENILSLFVEKIENLNKIYKSTSNLIFS